MQAIWEFGQTLLKMEDPRQIEDAFRSGFEHSYYAAKGAHYQDVLYHILMNSRPDSWFRCNLNGTDCWLPRDSLIMMRHCVFDRLENSILIMIEGRHTKWMMERLDPEGIYVDIGAFSGAMVVPFAAANPNMKVYAFEPARRAYERLQQTIQMNNLSNVALHNIALSDNKGISSFAEIDDIEGHVNAPEGSSIQHENINFSINTTRTTNYDVAIDTIDSLLLDSAPANGKKSVFKIDVEGFEMNVLAGGRNFIQRHLPALSIDIHADPFGSGETEQAVRNFLSQHGYSFLRLDHVLVCEPPRT